VAVVSLSAGEAAVYNILDFVALDLAVPSFDMKQ